MCCMLLYRELTADHDKRATNHANLLDALKSVNQMIQRASRLRVGSRQAKVVTACRAAIKAHNMQALSRIIREGEAVAV